MPEVRAAGPRPPGTRDRFAFGVNWRSYLELVDDGRIGEMERSLRETLGVGRLDGLSLLDVGSGSGLASLAALRLGAARVRSFDFDPESVAATRALKQRFAPAAENWLIEAGDVTDPGYLANLGIFDIVYAWGVLHHTGSMWRSLDNVARLVAPGGRLWISIYNDQGRKSHVWRSLKRTYNRLTPGLRLPYLVAVGTPLELRAAAGAVVRGEPGAYVRSWTQPRVRGMSRWHDLVDWIGGYPFEVAKPEEVFAFCRDLGFTLEHLRTAGGGLGTNEFVFARRELPGPA